MVIKIEFTPFPVCKFFRFKKVFLKLWLPYFKAVTISGNGHAHFLILLAKNYLLTADREVVETSFFTLSTGLFYSKMLH